MYSFCSPLVKDYFITFRPTNYLTQSLYHTCRDKSAGHSKDDTPGEVLTTEPERADVDEDVDDHDDQATNPLLVQLDGYKNSVGLICLLTLYRSGLYRHNWVGKVPLYFCRSDPRF